MSDSVLVRANSYRKNLIQKRPGKRQQVNLILQEFGSIKVMSDVDIKLIDHLYAHSTTDRNKARKDAEKIIKDSFCYSSAGRIYLTIKLILEMNFSDLLEEVLQKIKCFVQKKICKHSKKVKKIFKILNEVQICAVELVKEIENKFKFPSHAKLAYKMAKAQ